MVVYSFYRNSFHGDAIPVDNWKYYAVRAAEQLQEYKRRFTVTAPDEGSESMAICAMAECLYSIDQIASGNGGPVQSAKIGSVSVSYGTAVAGGIDISTKGQERELLRTARKYLEVYRGCC